MNETINIGGCEFTIDGDVSKLAEAQEGLAELVRRLGIKDISARLVINNKFVEVKSARGNFTNAAGELVIKEGLFYVFGIVGGPFDKGGAHYPG